MADANWLLLGNSGSSPATDFLGTTDRQPLVIRTANVERMRIGFGGRIGIGTASPGARLDVREKDGLVQVGRTQPTLVTGSDNGGALYFGVDSSRGSGHPTAAIETSWGGGALNPQIAIGVTRDFAGGKTASLLLDYTGNAIVRQGTTPRLFVQGTSGRVGIGTSSPGAQLDLRDQDGLVQAGRTQPTLVKGSDNGGALYFGVDSSRGSGHPTAAIETSWGGGALNPQIAIGVTRDFAGGKTASLLLDYTGNAIVRQGTTPRLVVQGTSGHVGIATSGPRSRLHVVGPGGGAVVATFEQPSGMNFVDLLSQTGGGNYGSALRFIDHANVTAQINSTADGQLRLATSGVEHVFVLGSGNVGIGTAIPAAKLEVSGEVQASDFVIISDRRSKDRVEPLTGVLERLRQVRGVSFERQGDRGAQDAPPQRREIGVIAQEVEAAFPELVRTRGEDGWKAVAHGGLLGVLVEAVKELRAEKEEQVRSLSSEILAGHGAIAALLRRTAELESRLAAVEGVGPCPSLG